MKTNFYILTIFLLMFSFTNAQSSTVETLKGDVNATVSVDIKEVTVENEAVLIEASQTKDGITRINSDIKLYLNRFRNLDNLNILFPKINEAQEA